MRQVGWIGAILALGLLIGWAVRGAADQPHYALTVSYYDDWRLTCTQQQRAGMGCQLSQEVVDRKTRGSIVRFVLWHQKDTPMVSIVVPVNILLPPGIGVRLGKKPTTFYPYKTCDQGGCLASIQGDKTLFEAVEHASELHVVVASLNGKSVDIKMSTKGLREGTAGMRDVEAASRSWFRRVFS